MAAPREGCTPGPRTGHTRSHSGSADQAMSVCFTNLIHRLRHLRHELVGAHTTYANGCHIWRRMNSTSLDALSPEPSPSPCCCKCMDQDNLASMSTGARPKSVHIRVHRLMNKRQTDLDPGASFSVCVLSSLVLVWCAVSGRQLQTRLLPFLRGPFSRKLFYDLLQGQVSNGSCGWILRILFTACVFSCICLFESAAHPRFPCGVPRWCP